MRKYKPTLVTEEDVKVNTDEVISDSKETILSVSPSKPVKTLLEERFDSKQPDSTSNQPENIGVDKKTFTISTLPNKSEKSCWI